MDFFNDIFHNLALLEFYFLNIIYILLYIDFILSIFFQHSNILTRASHHWCLASNIVLVRTTDVVTGFYGTSIIWLIRRVGGVRQIGSNTNKEFWLPWRQVTENVPNSYNQFTVTKNIWQHQYFAWKQQNCMLFISFCRIGIVISRSP